jgi:hypothetical protein
VLPSFRGASEAARWAELKKQVEPRVRMVGV